MERKVIFDNGDEYILRHYYNTEEGEFGIEVWNIENKRCLCCIPGVEFLDDDDPDAAEWNEKELAFIQEEFFNN